METIDFLESQDINPEIISSSIFQDFNSLSIGEELTLNIDHEPMDLYQQFEERYSGNFIWNYIEDGPDIWFVSIVKTGKDILTVGDVLAENPKAFTVLRKYNMDTCCKGNLLFSDACNEAGVSLKQIFKEIEESENPLESNFHVSEWPLDFLVEYIIMNHHAFSIEKSKQIYNILRDLQNKEEEINPLIFKINLIFINIHDALKKHIKEEEEVIFPAIKALVKSGLPPQNLPHKTLRKSIPILQKENNAISAGLSPIREITKNLFVPKHSKSNTMLLLQAFNEFERDLQYHLHLENNILFPKAVFLEDEAYIWED